VSDEHAIRVNFGSWVALFPLDKVVLLPQQVMPLHIFEPRYVQMVTHALDASGQIAMGVFAGDRWKREYHGSPPVRPAACLGQIVQHQRMSDGRYNILLQGVCRARITAEQNADDQTLYRRVALEPIDRPSLPGEGEPLERLRDEIERSIATGELSRVAVADQVIEYVRNEDIPTEVVLELVSFAMVTEPAARYALLAEGSATRRAGLLRESLGRLERLIRQAGAQRPDTWPKGVSWN
jgi:hypothetical protein